MASLTDLLRYKEEIEILHPVTGKPLKKVWVRVLGDNDLNIAYKIARIASSKKRQALRDETSEDYQDEVLGVLELSREEKEDLVKTSKLSLYVSEAQSNVVRPNLPTLEEVAIDPDAATLEELEILDKKEKEIEEQYQKTIKEYIDTKKIELDLELRTKAEEDLDKQAMFEVSNIIPFSTFINELADQKIFLGTFKDKTCKEREFENIEEVKNLPKVIKDFISEKISALEVNYEEIKN